MSLLIDIISLILICAGGLLGIIGAIGLFRFPDFYTRVHAAGIIDTLFPGLIIAGLVLQSGLSLMSVKLILIFLILAYTNPTATHTLAKTARKHGLSPIIDDKPSSKSVKMKRNKANEDKGETSSIS